MCKRSCCVVFSSKADCKQCPEGYYCDGTLQNNTVCSHGVNNPMPCLPGYYCPSGTQFSAQYPCPNGTFNPNTHLKDSSECQLCTGGMYCDAPGLPGPAGQCLGGYYCTLGAWSPTPVDGTTGDICEMGGYCPPGSNVTTQCPPGTYNMGYGQSCTFSLSFSDVLFTLF
jgi:hypothetical protein